MSRSQTFMIFFSVLLSVFGLLQVYLVLSYRSWVRRAFAPEYFRDRWKSGVWVLIAGNVLFLLSFASRGFGWYSIPAIRYGIIYPAGFFFSSIILAFVITFLKDVVRLPVIAVRHAVEILRRLGNVDSTTTGGLPEIPDEGRRRFLRIAGVTTIATYVGMPVLASIVSARDYKVNRIPLYFKNLPTGLQGLTIAQLSDLHAGVYMSTEHLLEIFEITNSLHPLLTVVTGDFVDSNDDEIRAVYDTIPTLKADYGVWGCLGNHDHFATAEKVNAAMVERKIIMLNNEHRTLAVNGEEIDFIGVDDFGGGKRNFARPELAFDGLRKDSFKILLTHRPDFFDVARKANIDLSLAGHTHGGQVGFDIGPIKLNPVYLVHKYPMGLFVEEEEQLYVNVGVGMVGAAIRLVRPEVSLFTLNKA